MNDPECELTELPASMCACPRHRGGKVVEFETARTPFPAQYDGACPRCGDPIREGYLIQRLTDGGGYIHARC